MFNALAQRRTRLAALPLTLALAGAALSGCAAPKTVAAQSSKAAPVASEESQSTAVETPTPEPSEPVHGLLVYPFPGGTDYSLDLDVIDPTIGQVVASHHYPFSYLAGDAHMYGHPRPSANRAFSSDLSMTLGYKSAADGTTQLIVSTDDGQQIEASQPLAEADSFSGALGASNAFFADKHLYLVMGSGSEATQYSIPEETLRSGNFGASDFTKSDVDSNDDGVSGADITGSFDDDTCIHNHGRAWNGGLGFLQNGRWLGLTYVSTGLVDRAANILSFKSGCRYDLSDAGGRELLPPTKQLIAQAAVSPDGTQIAFVATQNDTATIYTIPQDGGTPTEAYSLQQARSILAGWR